MSMKEYGILALDNMAIEDAFKLARELEGKVRGFKVNDALYDEIGAHRVIAGLRPYGLVFADPKLHDIPTTVANSAARFAKMGASLLTVHAGESPDCVEAASVAFHAHADADALGVLGVTLLTTIDADQCWAAYSREPEEQVLRAVENAMRGVAYGVVCSPRELDPIQARFPGLVCVTPGVRSPGADKHEQARVDTPAKAITGGARLIVVGREVTQAHDRIAAVAAIDAHLEHEGIV